MGIHNFYIQELDRIFLSKHIEEFIGILKDNPNEYWQKEHFLIDLPEKWLYSFVTLDGRGNVAGYIIASKKKDGNVHIHKFMVKKKYRSKGLGKKMLNLLSKKCFAEKKDQISLKVYKNNTEAIRFYEEYGFKSTLTLYEVIKMIGDVNIIRMKTKLIEMEY